MLAKPLESVVRRLRRWADPGVVEAADGALLRAYVAGRDESAFATLVRRHGPMVFGVCKRVLGHCHDAEDALQAAFLVLARKASSVQPPDLVGNWLYGVAYRTALEARSRALRRRTHEKQVSPMPQPIVEPQADLGELKQVLDQELSRLPDKYRAAVVLCELEGRSRREAAALLKIAEGTLSSRLAAARELLAARFRKRGWGPATAPLMALLAPSASQAAISQELLATVAKAGAGVAGLSANAVTLAEGVMKTMFLAKLKMLASCLLAFCLTAGAAVVAMATAGPSGDAAQTTTQQDTRTNQNQRTEVSRVHNQGDAKKDDAKKDDARKEEPKPAGLPAFSKIHLKQGAAIIRQTGKEIIGDQSNREATVENGTLILQGATPAAEFVIEVKELTSLKVDGVGKVQVLDLKGKKLELLVTKPAQVAMTGSVEEQIIEVAAGAQVDAQACQAKQAAVKVASGGTAIVHVSDKLRATVAAGGRLEYVGAPRIEEKVSPGGTLAPREPQESGVRDQESGKEKPPAAKAAVTLTAEVDGYTQGTMFNMQKYPFKYTGTSALDAEQLKSLAKPGDVPAATAKALLSCLLWPKMDDALPKAALKSDGKKLTGDVEVMHKYGKQGTHILKLRIEGVIADGRITLKAVNPSVSGSWDYGGGSIKLAGEVKIVISAK